MHKEIYGNWCSIVITPAGLSCMHSVWDTEFYSIQQQTKICDFQKTGDS